MPSVIGIDLGGTKLAIARFDAQSWAMQDAETTPTAGKSFPVIVEEMLAGIEKFRTADTQAIGVGVPGLVDRSDGSMRAIPNIPAGDGFPLLKTLEEKTTLRVAIENDSACFTLAEARQGAGKGHDVVVGITMGTGVGGGIVLAGRLYQGSHGFAAEFGHMLLRPGEPPIEDGNGRGDIEQFLSGTALRKRCPAAKRPEETLAGPTCAHLHETVVREIAWMSCSLIHCIDPGIIVFGGSAGRALKPHLPGIEKELRSWLLPKSPLPALAIGSLEHAGTLGAALLTQK